MFPCGRKEPPPSAQPFNRFWDIARLRIAIACSTIVDEWQRHARRRFRLDLSNGMRLALLTTVADDLRTMLRSGLATVALPTPRARTNDVSVMTALPLTL
jgi:hypothetical protein